MVRVVGFLLLFVVIGPQRFVVGLKPSFSPPPPPPPVNRRHVLQSAVFGAVSSGLLSSSSAVASEDKRTTTTITSTSTRSDFQVYQVFPDSSESLNPTLASVERLPSLAQADGALWLGEHHNSIRDHNLQAQLIRDIYLERRQAQKDNNNNIMAKTIAPKMAIGLEQIQLKFQPVLDDYVNGKISAPVMRRLVEWDKRWSWSFEGYAPVFEVARHYRIPLLALNVNSEDLAMVERQDAGLSGLSRDLLDFYIADRSGFASFARTRSFSSYVDYVIRPSFELHQQMGLLRRTIAGEVLDQDMSFGTFLSGRLLWDETMASRAHAWTMANPGGLLVGLVGADHVKFESGIPGRYARMAAASNVAAMAAAAAAAAAADAAAGPRRSSGMTVAATAASECCSISVLLNPTLIDTRPPGSVGMDNASMAAGAGSASRPDLITLQLRYYNDNVNIKTATPQVLAQPSSTGGVLPLADYLIIGG